MPKPLLRESAPQAPGVTFPWLAHYPQGVPASLAYRKVPLYAWLDEAADESPKNIACQFYNTKLSYAQLRTKAEQMAAALRRRGVQPGDRVGLMLPNLPQTMIAFWGVLKAGAVVTMLNPLYMEKELLHQINDAGIKVLITLDQCWPKIEKLREQIQVEQFYITTAAKALGFPLNLLARAKAWRSNTGVPITYGKNMYPFEDLLQGREQLCVAVANPEKDLALLQYTGGTTGLAKGTMLTHANLGINSQQTLAALPGLIESPQIILGVLPFFHVYGLSICLVLPTMLRACVAPVAKFSPGELLQQVSRYKATVLPGAPAMYIALLQQKQNKKHDVPSLKYCISGSAPMPIEYLTRFEQEFNATLIEGYGLSEASPITHLNPATGQRKHGSIGLPFPDTEARIVDMELGHVPLPPGKIGEMILRGPQVMRGYWNASEETANTLRDGWLYTGDIAMMDEEGYFFIVDRKKDMIIVGGYNVSPREVDEVLYTHPKVQEAVTVGIPHPTRGEILKAYVVPKPGAELTRTDIMSWCRQYLANFKVPRQVEFRTELPKTIVGKVLRRSLRAEEEQRLQSSRSKKEGASTDAPTKADQGTTV